MKIEELKDKIETNTLGDDPLVLVYKNSGRLVCEQYIDQIAKDHNLEKKYFNIENNLVKTAYDFGDLFGAWDDGLFLYITFTDNLESDSYIKPSHIICCHKVSKDIKDKFSNNIVDIPEVEQWQLKGYAQGVLKGFSEDRLNWLCNTPISSYRFMTEINRLKMFVDSLQNDLFDQMVDEGFFDDIIEVSIFALTTAVQRKDSISVGNIYKTIQSSNINPIAFNNILYNSFKDITAIKLSPVATAQALGIEPKKFNALKHYVGYFNKDQLLSILDMLSSTDYKIKTGQMPTNILLDYLITNILAI